MNTEILKNRENIDKWFVGRFKKEKQLKEYKGILQGEYVEVDFSTIILGKKRKYKKIKSLLVVAIIPENSTFIGMSDLMELCQVPLSIIKKLQA